MIKISCISIVLGIIVVGLIVMAVGHFSGKSNMTPCLASKGLGLIFAVFPVIGIFVIELLFWKLF